MRRCTSLGCLRYCKSTSFQANHNWIGKEKGREKLFAILQKYEFSSKSQQRLQLKCNCLSCLRYCKSTSFQANHNSALSVVFFWALFAILQKYEFSSKSQRVLLPWPMNNRCLRYCKSTSFQANHNLLRFLFRTRLLFAILQKYEFSSKSQPAYCDGISLICCLRYCKSTSFQANHNSRLIS